MRSATVCRHLGTLLAVAALGSCGRAENDRAAKQDASKAGAWLFGATDLPSIRLTLDHPSMAELGRESFKYVRGSLKAGDWHLEAVGVRFKGEALWSGKPGFKLRFDRYDKSARLDGLKDLALNSMRDDPTRVRAHLAFQVFAALGVPVPRTQYVSVFVNEKPYGVYLAVEETDDYFLRRNFTDASGPLYEGDQGCDLYPDDVWGFDRDSGHDEERQLLLALAEDATKLPAGKLFSADSPLSISTFLAYLAVSTVVADVDGYRKAENYRIYRDPDTEKWTFIPWGLDRSFVRDLGIYESEGWLARRCFSDAACRLAYVRALGRVLDVISTMDLPARMKEISERIRVALVNDSRSRYSRDDVARARIELGTFLAARPGQIRQQTACLQGDVEVDEDGDGYGCIDCDDHDRLVHPGAKELCDGKDNNCSSLIDDAPECQCPSHDIDGARFSLCNLPMSWDDAARFCRDRGEALATIDNSSQALFLHQLTRRSSEDAWWIGLNDRGKEGVFRWLDDAAVTFESWADDEPDNYVCGQDCVALHDERAELTDRHCGDRIPFICRATADEP